MSQSSIAEQVAELKKGGANVRVGEVKKPVGPIPKGESISVIGTRVWLKAWAQQAFANYPVVKRATGVRFLVNSCTGLPAVVVGIGPSLDDAYDDLKKAVGRCIIIATDAAFRPLMAKGIKPDLVISFDCKAKQSLLWETVPQHNVPCLFSTCSHPDAIRSWAGPVLFYNQYHQSDELCEKLLPMVYPDIGQLPSAATVGNMAALLTKLLGCSRALCVGMDFCYRSTPDMEGGYTWLYRAKDWRYEAAEGFPNGRWTETEIKPLYDNDERVGRSYEVESNGQKYRVDPELDAYYGIFLNQTKHFKAAAVNCSPKSRLATVKDIETIPLAEAIEKFADKNPMFGGRTILPFLDRILKDPRAGHDQ